MVGVFGGGGSRGFSRGFPARREGGVLPDGMRARAPGGGGIFHGFGRMHTRLRDAVPEEEEMPLFRPSSVITI